MGFLDFMFRLFHPRNERRGGGTVTPVPQKAPVLIEVDTKIEQSNILLGEARDLLSTYRDEVRYYEELTKSPRRRRVGTGGRE